jgi:hypothetical protein
MGFDKTTGTTAYDMTVFLTPLGVEKFYTRGLVDGVKLFSISDAGTNYLAYSGLTYNYDITSGGTYSPHQPTLGYTLNLRGTVDRNLIIEKKALATNSTSLRSAVWQYPTIDPSDEVLTVYRLSKNDKIFDKPLVLGSRNMWHKTLSTAVNKAEGFLYYLPPAHPTPDYIDTVEPTWGVVTTGATDYVPFPGVSVNDGHRSFTEIQYFYYLNKTSKHMFLNSFSVENILPTTHTVTDTVTTENYSSEFVKQTYYLQWTSIKDSLVYTDSAINVFIPKFVYDRSRIVLFPFEIVRFGVSFEIYQAGSVVTHWHGQNYSNQTAKEGQYEFKLVLAATPELGSATIYSTKMDVVVKVKDSAYVASTYVHPTPHPTGGGGIGVVIGDGRGTLAG